MRRTIVAAMLIGTLLITGCQSRPLKSDKGVGPYQPFLQQIEYPDVKELDLDVARKADLLSAPPPPSVRDPEETPKRPITLEEAIRITLQQSQVIRDLGGRVLQNADVNPTVFDPALQETNALRGVEAALSAFDAQFTTSLFTNRVDRRFNNVFFASAGSQRQQANFNMGISKTTAAGTRVALENITTYERLILPEGRIPADSGNQFFGVYDTVIQGSFRHPLLQGGGMEFNRIAGPNATPGNYNGIVLARIGVDQTLAQFEQSVRDLLRDVESTYWDLYFAYRDLDTKLAGRALSLRSWCVTQRRVQVGVRDYPPDQEAFARAQYYADQAAVEAAITNLYNRENDLRNLLGLPPTDGTILVPSTDPVMADVQFDWNESLSSALTRRVELRRQEWNIKRREMELIAARNFLKMRLDLVGEYRWYGFGDELFGEGNAIALQRDDMGRVRPVELPRQARSAFGDLFGGDLQEYRFGIELTTPVGNRIGHTAVRNAELQLTRERTVLDEMHLRMSNDLRKAFAELDRAYVVSRSSYNQLVAALIRLQNEQERYDAGGSNPQRGDPLFLLLDAQRQAVNAESSFHRAIADYNQALMNLHRERGTLLDSYRVILAEGPWSPEAHESARKQSRRFRPRKARCFPIPSPVSRGAYPQEAEAYEAVPPGEPTPAPEMIPAPTADPSAGGNPPAGGMRSGAEPGFLPPATSPGDPSKRAPLTPPAVPPQATRVLPQGAGVPGTPLQPMSPR